MCKFLTFYKTFSLACFLFNKSYFNCLIFKNYTNFELKKSVPSRRLAMKFEKFGESRESPIEYGRIPASLNSRLNL